MPNDATLTTLNMLFSGLNPKILVVAAGFFGAGVEHNEVVDDF